MIIRLTTALPLYIKCALSLCRNISPTAGCLLQHQCLLGVFRAGLGWAVTGHEVMWQLLFHSQVLNTTDYWHFVDCFFYHLWICWIVFNLKPKNSQSPFLWNFYLFMFFFSPCRYHKLVWGPYGMDSGAHPSGVLITGSENGNVILYDPAKIMAGASDVIIAESDRHTGPVRALDVNPFQVWSISSCVAEFNIHCV